MRILLFGATGTAGSGVLRACLQHPAVTEIRVVARRPIAVRDARLRVSLHENYHDYAGAVEALNLTSRFMWARVKAETERDLQLVVPTVCWRPAFIDGGVSQRGPLLYRAIQPMFRAFSFIRSIYVASEDIGWAMLHAVRSDVREGVIANARIRELADRERVARDTRSVPAL